MIEGFPTGTIIGDMEAPFKWILDHTKRFQGIVQVAIGDGKGYVLLDRGSPVGCFFILGGKILRGRMALKYLIELPLVSLSIRKYSREELLTATRLLDPTEMISHPQAAISSPPSPPVVDIFYDREEDLSIQSEYSKEPEEEPEGEADIEYPNNLDTDLIAQLLLGKILRLPHVQAVTVFGKGTPVLSMGDMNLEPVVIFADDILQATKDITAVMDTGAFLHYTLHVPSGYIIIAPYFDEYLCILTDPKINLGIVRKILKEIPADKERMRGVA